MKRIMSLVLAVAMMLPMGALAENLAAVPSVTTANAVTECVNTYDVVAPFAGVLQPFTWERGDAVKAHDVLFMLDTVKVYAPATGKVQGLFVDEGDLCEDAMAQYGMIAGIEKTQVMVVDASTKGRHSDEENKIIHLGDTVYIEETNDTDNVGEGRIVTLTGDDFIIELTSGDFEMDDDVKIYRDGKMSSKTCIGTGKMARGQDVKVNGSGRVLKSYFTQGQTIRKGQLMFELISAEADPAITSALVSAGHDGVLDAPLVASGQQVYKGQALVTVHDVSALQVVAEVDEMDLDKVHVGDSLSIIFDRYPNSQVTGTVRSIAQMGREKQNATYYDVEISFTTSVEVLPGMNATVYLPNGQ